MLNARLAQKYAQALYELAQEQNCLAETLQELEGVAAGVQAQKELSVFLFHPRVDGAIKKETLQQVFGEVGELVHKFLSLLIDKRRESLLPAIAAEFRLMAHAAQNMVEADVVTAVPLRETQKEALAARLGQLTGKTVLLRQRQDASLIGGLMVYIGGKRIDGSVKGQLERLKRNLAIQDAMKSGVSERL